jgi:ABC-type uncharacterized transport system substrate-binding protein
VFTSIPRKSPSGALFELGADYLSIGRAAGNIAADVLDGKDPAGIPVENLMPITLQVNVLSLKDLREKWELPDALIQRANVVVDETGRHVKNQPAEVANPEMKSAPQTPGAGSK